MKILKYCLVLSIIAFASACGDKDEESKSPAELVIGTWEVESVTLFGVTIPEGSSTLTFNSCDGDDCTGVDYNGIDETSGEFSYTLSADGKTLAIDDDSENGGAYGGTWDVEELNSSTMRLSDETIFGPAGFTLKK